MSENEKPVWGSVTDYSKSRNVSRAYIYAAIKKHKIGRKAKDLNFTQLDKILNRSPDGKKLEVSTDNNTNRLTRARADKEDAKAQIEQLKLLELQGELLKRQSIVDAAMVVMTYVKKEMIDMPNKLTPHIAACGGNEHEIKKVITGGVEEVMSRLYGLKNLCDEDGKGRDIKETDE